MKVPTKNQLLALFFQFNENLSMDAKKKFIKCNEKPSSQKISVQSDIASPTSQVGDLFF